MPTILRALWITKRSTVEELCVGAFIFSVLAGIAFFSFGAALMASKYATALILLICMGSNILAAYIRFRLITEALNGQ